MSYQNIGGYDKYENNESLGNAELVKLFETGRRFKTHFAANDKNPNHDGYFELLKDHPSGTKKVAEGQIYVQIKTLDHDYKNNNVKGVISDYKYKCDTKIFNTVLSHMLLDPAYLLLYDCRANKVFFINLEYDYVNKLSIGTQDEKIIYFNDSDMIVDMDMFYQYSKKIYNERKQIITEFNINKALTKSEDIALLQDVIDYVENQLNSNFKILKNTVLKDIWKIGIAYTITPKNFTFAFYEIRRGETTKQIKQIVPNEQIRYLSKVLVGVKWEHTNKEKLLKIVNDFFLKKQLNIIKDNPELLLCHCSNLALEEIVYIFLDEVATTLHEYAKENYPTVFYKDIVHIDEVLLFLKTLYTVNFEEFKNLFDETYSLETTNPFHLFIFDKNREKAIQLWRQFIAEKRVSFNDQRYIIRYNDKDFVLFHYAMKEILKRNIQEIKRPWRHRDIIRFSQDLEGISGFDRIETGYRMDDYWYNVEKLISIMPTEYSNFIKSISDSKENMYSNNKTYYFYYDYGSPLLNFEAYIYPCEEFKILCNKDISEHHKNQTSYCHTKYDFSRIIQSDKPILFTQLKELLLYISYKHLNYEYRVEGKSIFNY